MLCPQCSTKISPHLSICPDCDQHVGFPNVRAASEPHETAALEQRYDKAFDASRQDGSEAILKSFEQAVAASQAVMSRRLGVLTKIFRQGKPLFRTFYQQVDADDRLPEDSYYDRARLPVDTTFFSYFYKSVHFAALSLSKRGPASYGECTFVFRESHIAHRSSVFEENTLVFCEKHPISVGQPPPSGFRAVWSRRHQLAVAKLHARINRQTTQGDFAGLLLTQKGATNKDEFIEVHIYGKLDPKAVAEFSVPKAKLKADKVLAESLMQELKEAGVNVRAV